MDLHLHRHLKNAVLRRVAWHRWNLKTHGMGFGHKRSLSEMFEARNDHVKQFVVLGVIAAVIVLVFKSMWSASVPYGLFQVWETHGTVSEWLWTSKWVLAWGIGVTAILAMISRNKPEENRNAEGNYAQGILISVMAGVLEEITYRWIYFLVYIFFCVVLNYVLGGFAGHGFVEWVTGWFAWVANWATLGYLEPQLIHSEHWAVAAGILCANGCFRDGHKYLGLFGYVNSWFIGMFFFFLMFTYGLPAAILVHFLYDFGIFTVRYIDQVIERAEGNT